MAKVPIRAPGGIFVLIEPLISELGVEEIVWCRHQKLMRSVRAKNSVGKLCETLFIKVLDSVKAPGIFQRRC